MPRRYLWLVGLLVLGTSLPSATAGEEPADGDCDSTGRVVCAGADAGGSVTCVWVTPTSVACDWARGILWSGFSPIGLPGEVEGQATGFLEVCLNQSCSLDETPRDLPFCSWLPALDCVDGQSATGSVGPIELAMGQCLKVTAGEALAVTARVLSQDLTIAQASFSNQGEGADQECLVDDGR